MAKFITASEYASQEVAISKDDVTIVTGEKNFIVMFEAKGEWKARLLNKLYSDYADGELYVEKAMENPVFARITLGCNRKDSALVWSTTSPNKPATSTTCHLDKDEKQGLVEYLVDNLRQEGATVPRWLDEMAFPPLDAPSLNLSNLRPQPFGLYEAHLDRPDAMRFECELTADKTFKDALVTRCNIAKELLVKPSLYGRVNPDSTISAYETNPILYVCVNSDLTIDAYVYGRITQSNSVEKIDFPLTDKERKTILEAAMREKEKARARYEHFENEWSYLYIPLGSERLLERERTPEPKSEKTPRNHGDFER